MRGRELKCIKYQGNGKRTHWAYFLSFFLIYWPRGSVAGVNNEVDSLYANYLLNETLPPDALRILRSCLIFCGKADLTLALLDNLDAKMAEYASTFRSPSNDLIPSPAGCFIRRCEEFDHELRKVLLDIGPRVDLSTFRPEPLTDPTIHDGLAGACLAFGITVLHGYCEGVSIDGFGKARAEKKHVLRVKKGEILMDVMAIGPAAFHVVRYLANSKTSAILKMKMFSTMISLLFRTCTEISGSAASVNDASVFMEQGEWRFKEQESVWGFPISRLERFWLRCGAVSTRFIEDEKPRLILLKDCEAVEFLKRFRQEKTDGPSPFFYASRHGIYSPETLQKLKEKAA